MSDRERRKQLIRAYKEACRPMGVYRVRDRATGATLIGHSADLPSILNRHRAQLRMGLHPDRELQAGWNDRGPEGIDFEVLDTLDRADGDDSDPAADLAALKDLWREKLAADD